MSWRDEWFDEFRMLADALRRRLSARSPTQRPRRVLLCWWGILPNGEPTAGDFMAVANLARRLNTTKLPTDIASAHAIPEALLASEASSFPPVRCVAPEDVRPDEYGVLVFVCGPLVDDRDVMNFLWRFSAIPRLAAGVSVLPEQPRIQRLFHGIIARDGTSDALFDLALAGAPREAPQSVGRDGPVGICLRGAQREYGRKRCCRKQVEPAIHRACELLGGPRIVIDTRVLPPENSLAKVLEMFERPRVLITTRLHGALLALCAGRPFVAIDQIRGGAKLTSMLVGLGWPFLLGVEDATPERIVEMAREAQSSAFAARLVAFRRHAIDRSEAALDAVCQRVEEAVAGCGGCEG